MQAVAAIVRLAFPLTVAGVVFALADLTAAETKVIAPPAISPKPSEGSAVSQTNAAITSSLGNPTNSSYILIPDDVVRVEVYKEPDLLRQTRVDQDGTISLPLIETVHVGGKTVAEARALIRKLYEKDYLVSAGVDVILVTSARTNEVVKTKTHKYTVSGAVKKPGIIEFKEGEKVSLVEAILQAGDFSNVANKNKVSILRQENGAQKVYVEDVEAMLINPKSKRFEVMPGDVISVKQTIF